MVEDQLVDVGVNLVAAGVTAGSGVGASKACDLLRQRRFSEDIDGVATVFHEALRDAIAEEDARRDGGELAGVADQYGAIATELAVGDRTGEQIDVLFENESDAVERIAETIASVNGFDLERTPELRTALERAVTRAYREAIVEFEQRIAGTELQDVFEAETGLVLTDRMNQLQDGLSALHDDVESLLERGVADEGFRRLTPTYFARTPLRTPATCWRIGFSLAEIRAGYYFDRRHESARSIADELVERLDAGRNQAVVGPPGAGKSTLCKAVACEWYESTAGTVFYRRSNAPKPFDRVGAVEDAIRRADGPTLVVVEDAARRETSAVYHLIERFQGDDDVAFLLDARQSEWQESLGSVIGTRLEALRTESVETYRLPSITESECERAIETFERTTGRRSHHDAESLAADLESANVGEMYLLAYRLASGLEQADGPTVLETAVEEAYARLEQRCSPDDHLPLRLGILINVLNAAGIEIRPDLLQTLGESNDEHGRIDDLLRSFEGELLFDGADGYRSHHPLWSSLFFRQLIDEIGSVRAADHFSTVVNGLFSLVDDDETRARIDRWVEEPTYVRRAEREPTETADWLALTVFNMGDADPRYAFSRASSGGRQPIFHVAPLFGTADDSWIELPDSCSPEVRLRCVNLRGVMYLDTGEFERAEAEFEHLHQRIGFLDVSEERRIEIEAWTLNNRGDAVRRQGELDRADALHERSLRRFHEVGEPIGEAWTLNNIANVNRLREDLDTAERYHADALEIFESLDATQGRGWVLNNLGLVSRLRGELDEAEQRHLEALDAFRRIGHQLGETRVRNALGLVARERERYEEALSYFRQSRRLAREIGDTQCVAWATNNVGTVHERRGELSVARERYLESLEIKRELGDRKGAANTLSNVASVAVKRGDPETADGRLEASIETLLEIRMPTLALETLEELVELYADRGYAARAASWCDRGVETAAEHDTDGQATVFREHGDALTREP